MSKKMLKRSLALGALMAFVITGSAMAADVTVDLKGDSPTYGDYNSSGFNADGKNVYITGTDTETITFDLDGTQMALRAFGTIEVNKVKDIVIQGTYKSTDPSAGYSGNVFYANGGYGTSTIKFTEIGTIKTGDVIKGAMSFQATSGGVITVDADVIDLKNVGNAIVVQDGLPNDTNTNVKTSTFTVDAKKINIESNSSTIYTNNGSSYKGGTYTKLSADEIYLASKKGVVYSGNGINDIDILGGYIKLEADTDNDGNGVAIKVSEGSKESVVNIVGTNGVDIIGGIEAYGSNSNLTIDGGTETNIEGAVKVGTYNAHDGKINVTLKGKDITIDSGASYGVVAWGAQGTLDDEINIKLGDEKTENVTIKNFTYAGVLAGYDESIVEVNADKFEVTGKGTGIWAANGTCGTDELTNNDDNDSAKSSIVISERTDTIINVDENAICAMSDGVVDIKGNLYAKSEEVIVARGGATVNINNENKNKVVELIGDIAFNYNGENSGTPVDANININLTNADSFFTGKIGITGKNIPKGYDEVNSMNIKVTNGAQWNLTGASIVNHAEFGKDSVLNLVNGELYNSVNKDAVYALNASGAGDNSLEVEEGAKLQIDGIKETTYNIATGFANYDDVKGWTEIVDNALMEANKVIDTTNKTLQVEIKTKEAEQMATEMGISNSTAQSVANVTAAAQAAIDGGAVAKPEGTGNDKAVALVQAMANANPQAAGQAFEAVSKMAEAGGNSGTAASIVKNVTGVTNDRLSFNCGHSAPHKGGHGVGLFEEGSGADVWVEYVHGKDEVEDMPSTAGATSYEGQYNGIVMGVDFKKVNKFQSGFAFNYGEGDTNSVGSAARTHSDYDFWGIGYYGSIHNDDSNVIFDIGYAKTDSDVETKALGMTYNASPETTTWTAGVKVEKLYQNENVQIVPYTGLRFMSIDPEDYSTKCASSKYQMERQNVWLLPLGVSIRQEIANDNGWTVSPKVDLSYIWAFGDTDSEMEFSTLGTKTNIGYEVMDDGSFLGLVGIEAHKGQWGFGVSYSYQKGDYSTSKKWFIDANYSF